MEHVSSPKRVDRFHFECSHMADLAFIYPIDAVIAVGDCEKAIEMLPELFQCGGQIVKSGAAAQRFS